MFFSKISSLLVHPGIPELHSIFYPNNGYLAYLAFSNWGAKSGRHVYAIIKYIKTTDTENSFKTTMITDYIVQGGSGSSCECETYTNEEVSTAIDKALNNTKEEVV